MPSNGKGDIPRGAMTLEEKMDSLLDGLVEVREMMELVPEMSEKMQELIDTQQEILEKLQELGLDSGDGFERFDS